MTTWHWVRHGPTHQKNFVGWRDVPADLSDHAAIERLNAHLPASALLVSSDLIRASATADRLEQGRNRLPHAPQIREFNLGLWDGQHFEQVSSEYPELSRKYWEEPGDIAPPEGESWNQVAARIAPFVDHMNTAHPEAHVIAVAHIGVILTQLQRATGKSAYDCLAQSIDNLSVTTLQFDKASWSLTQVNHNP